METHKLFHEYCEAVGYKKAALFTGRTDSLMYKMARSPADKGSAHNFHDWIEALVMGGAGYEDARPVLRRWEIWYRNLFARALSRASAEPVPHSRISADAVKLLREVADVIDVTHARELDDDRMLNEVIEAEEVLARIRECLEARIEHTYAKKVRRAG